MRVAWEASALLPPRTGVGRYALALLRALQSLGDAPEIHLMWRSLRRGLEPAVRDQIRDAHLHIGRFPPGPWLQGMWDRWNFPAVERATGPVDLVHGLAAVLPASRARARVLTVHDLDFVRHPERVHRDGGGFLCRHLPKAIGRATRVIVPSTQTADDCVDLLGADRARIRVVPHGGAEEFAAPPTAAEEAEAREWLRDLPERFTLCIATLEPRKNLARLLDAIDLLHARRADVPSLVLVGGEGWGTPDLVARLRDSTPPEKCLWLGHRPPVALRALLHRASALVMPSLAEGFGLPVLEAMASNCPVLCSDLPVLREVSGGHARFFDPEDVESIAAALSASLADPEGERARADAGLTHIAGFTWKRAAEATLAVYRESVGETGGKSP